MTLQHNISLRPFNSFGIDAKAKTFASFANVEDLLEALLLDKKRLILGGGSNILLLGDFDGAVLKNEIRGIELLREDEEYYYVRCGAGENWHQFVLHCIDNGYAGIENLSLIPGNTGASPMQNIGAYGVEIKDVFHELEALHIADKTVVVFSREDCEFGYRESVFKNRYKDQFVILNVSFQLRKQPVLNTSYGAIEEELERMGAAPSIRSVSQAVINIRSSKLPDPKQTGNAGSFFKNPVVSHAKYAELVAALTKVPGYPQENGDIKLAAGWLIEQAGWKGFRRGDAGCHDRQALVLVNYGSASGNDIYALSEDIRQSVLDRFGVVIEREVNLIQV